MELKDRIRGFLPVVIDLETGGINPLEHAVLEMCIVIPQWNNDRMLLGSVHHWHIEPHPNTLVDSESLEITGIDLADPTRDAIAEVDAVRACFRVVRKAIREAHCNRAVLTGHNSHFDLDFLRRAAFRSNVGQNPFHPFTVLDTASMSAVRFGQTVLSKVCEEAGIAYDTEQAHSAKYDAVITARLFCWLINDSAFDTTQLPRLPHR